MRYALAAFLLLAAAPAHAEELREVTECFDYGRILDAVAELDEVKPEYRDVVDVVPVARLAKAEEGVPPAERLFFRLDGEEHDIALPDVGVIEGFMETGARLGEEAEVCLTDPHFAGTPKQTQGRMFSVGMLPEWTVLDGVHTVDELREGTKDGRKFYKKLAPNMVSFLVPKLTHVAVSHPLDDADNLPTVHAFRGDEPLGEVAMEAFTVSQLLDLDTLEEMGATHIEVTGEYRLFPMPDAKTVKRFMQ